MWEDAFDIDDVREIRVKTTAYLGVGAIKKMVEIALTLKTMGVASALCVAGGSAYKKSGAWDHIINALEDAGISYALYDKITPNPTTDAVDEAASLGAKHGAQAVICIGGGSPIDAGKAAAILLANPGHNAEELFTGKFTPEKACPIIAVNLTHGTGSEANRFAIATIAKLHYKPAIAFDCIYPLYAIDDPALMASLPPAQTRYVSIDAVNHSIEAATTLTANPLSIELAADCIALVAKWLPEAEANPQDLRARYFLAYAALIAGVAFDNGMLHITHALEHPLSAVKPDLAHGLGLAMILPAVIKVIYPDRPQILAKILAPIVPGLVGAPDEGAKAADEVEKWLGKMGVPEKLSAKGFSEKDIPGLVRLAQDTPSLGLMLSLAPHSVTPQTISQIYSLSLAPMK